jgi:hypothetical protein
MTDRELTIKAHNYVIKNRLQLGAILNENYDGDKTGTPLAKVLMEVYKDAFREGQRADETKELRDKIEELEGTLEDLTDIKL